MSFTKHNPQHFTFTSPLLAIDVFTRLESTVIDSLYVTLKVNLSDNSRPAIRHNLDLFNDNQLSRLITKICERFEIGHSVASEALSKITDGLEAEQIKLMNIVDPDLSPLPELTDAPDKEEEKIALKSLKIADLMERTFKAFEVIGICGEQDNAMILFLTMLSRLLPEPLSAICTAKNGSGKSYLVQKIAYLLPKEEVLPHTQLTAASLYHHAKNELAGKVLLIEDLFMAKGAMPPITALQTQKKITKTMTIKDKMGDLRAMTFVVEGPLCVVACATYDKVRHDQANPCLILTLDNSAQQDQRIMDYQKRLRAGLIHEGNIQGTAIKLRHIQHVLRPVKIINPFAPLIELPKETINPRTTLPLVLNFIDTITFYHQYQREERVNENTGEVYIETHPNDIRWAFRLLKNVLFTKSDELTASARSFFDWLVAQKELQQEFFATTIRQHIKVHPRTLNRHLKELTEYGYLTITGGNRHTTGYSYKVNATHTDASLGNSIQLQLDVVLKKVEQAFAKMQANRKAKANLPAARLPKSYGGQEAKAKAGQTKSATSKPTAKRPTQTAKSSQKPATNQ